jgi:molybdenum cofactor synthesis domain-containing protein
VRVRCIVTGDEVLEITSPVEPWQLRDSNGSTLAAMFAACRWIDWCGAARVADDRHRLHQTVAAALATSDAVLLTGGVSMGDYDYVPTVLVELGCHIVFHRLPIRPGKPILGAIGPNGQVVLGLPGNPVSVATTARRFALPALRRLAGAAVPDKPVPLVAIANPKDDPLGLHWFRPVRLLADGQAELLITRGSGDIINTARSDGFVAYPPRQSGSGPWPYYIWSVSDE